MEAGADDAENPEGSPKLTLNRGQRNGLAIHRQRKQTLVIQSRVGLYILLVSAVLSRGCFGFSFVA